MRSNPFSFRDKTFFKFFFSGNLGLKKFTKFEIPNPIVGALKDSQWLQILPPNFSGGPLRFRDEAFLVFQNGN